MRAEQVERDHNVRIADHVCRHGFTSLSTVLVPRHAVLHLTAAWWGGVGGVGGTFFLFLSPCFSHFSVKAVVMQL